MNVSNTINSFFSEYFSDYSTPIVTSVALGLAIAVTCVALPRIFQGGRPSTSNVPPAVGRIKPFELILTSPPTSSTEKDQNLKTIKEIFSQVGCGIGSRNNLMFSYEDDNELIFQEFFLDPTANPSESSKTLIENIQDFVKNEPNLADYNINKKKMIEIEFLSLCIQFFKTENSHRTIGFCLQRDLRKKYPDFQQKIEFFNSAGELDDNTWSMKFLRSLA